MTELNFKGKEFVYNHHLSVPFHPLEMHPDKGIGEANLDGNLIIHGDNLKALKALMPIYAGKVDCIYIDPPYNTGNEHWRYNDNVNAPMIKDWLKANPIGIEDGLRHDKWCAMMWPRLRLLHDLLAEDGSFWMTLDDNEAPRGKLLLEEIFGSDNFVANFVWQSKDTPGNNSSGVAQTHNHILFFQKSTSFVANLLERNEEQIANYANPDNDPRGDWLPAPLTRGEHRDRDVYPISNSVGAFVVPPKGSSWRRPPEKMKWLQQDNRIWWGHSGDAEFPMEKKFLSEMKDGVVNQTWWPYEFAGSTRNAGAELKNIFDGEKTFDTPKPKALLGRIIELATQKDALILDSFAGSGTTAHAVLEANNRDGGKRRFIIVEMEEYADRLTAERIRRVIKGYTFTGTRRTELMREKITWSKLRNSRKLTESIEVIENLQGHEYDRIKKEVKNGELIVTGEESIAEYADGLGGSFTYCTLGDPVELDKLLSGETLPHYEGIGAALFHMATNCAIDAEIVRKAEYYLGEADGQHVWLIYKSDLDWLKSPEAALTLARARTFASADPEKRHLVFAPARYVSQKMLDEQNIPVEFVPLPFALYRIDRG
ncbi:MAG: site-specific DNA-methyltransferase [Nitrospinae bacterium]|nr:site-specific DNA-methyltransferase [Nitrospinota bacterium]